MPLASAFCYLRDGFTWARGHSRGSDCHANHHLAACDPGQGPGLSWASISPLSKKAACQTTKVSALTWALLGLGWKPPHSVKNLKAEAKPRAGWHHTWAEGERGPGHGNPSPTAKQEAASSASLTPL